MDTMSPEVLALLTPRKNVFEGALRTQARMLIGKRALGTVVAIEGDRVRVQESPSGAEVSVPMSEVGAYPATGPVAALMDALEHARQHRGTPSQEERFDALTDAVDELLAEIGEPPLVAGSYLNARSDERWEVADTKRANELYGCPVDDGCVLAAGHTGGCDGDRESWAGPDALYPSGSDVA